MSVHCPVLHEPPQVGGCVMEQVSVGRTHVQ